VLYMQDMENNPWRWLKISISGKATEGNRAYYIFHFEFIEEEPEAAQSREEKTSEEDAAEGTAKPGEEKAALTNENPVEEEAATPKEKRKSKPKLEMELPELINDEVAKLREASYAHIKYCKAQTPTLSETWYLDPAPKTRGNSRLQSLTASMSRVARVVPER